MARRLYLWRTSLRLGLACALGALVVQGATFAQAVQGRRIALVIGNGDYDALPGLKNPANDASDVAAALTRLGFSVTLKLDGSRKTMVRAIADFREALSSDSQSEGVFFYAGHGVQSSKGQNYLMPVDAEPRSESDYEAEGVPVQSVLDSLVEARNRVNLVVLDACRDNPLPPSTRGGGTRGLAVVGSNPPETIVLYSTAAQQTAADGSGENSPFTEAFLKYIDEPGDITMTIKLVTGEVKARTGDKQSPYVYMNLSRDFYLNRTARASGASPGGASPPGPSAYAPPAASAELAVAADREGAVIWIDGRKVGSAPNLFPGLPAGKELLVEARAGDYGASARISLEPSEQREISFRLELLKGTLYFPLPNASSYTLRLDGAGWGRLSAVGYAKDIGAGRYAAELVGDGLYWRGEVEVEPGVSTPIKASPFEVGSLRVEAPRGAMIRLIPSEAALSKAGSPIATGRGGDIFEFLPAGGYSMEASGPGFDAVAKSLVLAKGESKTIAPWTGGSLLVETDPPGVEVSVDGKSGGKSPVKLTEMRPGDATIVIDSREWKRIEEKKAVELGKTSRASYRLQPRLASLSLSLPADASFSLAGQSYSRSGRGETLLSDIPAGTYTLEAGGSGGYDKYAATVILGRGDAKRIVPWTTGSLAVTTEPIGASVWVAYRALGEDGIAAELEPGSVPVRVEHEGYVPASALATIVPGRRGNISIRLERALGEIDIEAPEGAESFFVGVDRSFSYMGSGIARGVPTGRYSVRIGGANVIPYEGGILVEENATSALRPYSSARLRVESDPPGMSFVVTRIPGSRQSSAASGRDAMMSASGSQQENSPMTSPFTLENLAGGHIVLSGSSPDCENVSKDIMLYPGQDLLVRFQAERHSGSIRYILPKGARAAIKGYGPGSGVEGEGILASVPTGDYEVEVLGEGFDEYDGTIVVSKGQTALFQPYTSGRLEILVDPPDAAILLDGRRWDSAINGSLRIPDLRERDYRIEASRKYYETGTCSARIETGKTKLVSLTLERQKGGLSYDISPDASAVLRSVNDVGVSYKLEGKGVLKDVPADMYVASAGGRDFYDHSESIEVRKGETSSFQPYTSGRVIIRNSRPEWILEIRENRGSSSSILTRMPGLPLQLSAGRHTLELWDFDKVVWSRTVDILPGRIYEYGVDILPRMGALEYELPSGLEIFLEFRPRDNSYSVEPISIKGAGRIAGLPIGHYRIGYGSDTVMLKRRVDAIEIKNGATHRLALEENPRVLFQSASNPQASDKGPLAIGAILWAGGDGELWEGRTPFLADWGEKREDSKRIFLPSLKDFGYDRSGQAGALDFSVVGSDQWGSTIDASLAGGSDRLAAEIALLPYWDGGSLTTSMETGKTPLMIGGAILGGAALGAGIEYLASGSPSPRMAISVFAGMARYFLPIFGLEYAIATFGNSESLSGLLGAAVFALPALGNEAGARGMLSNALANSALASLCAILPNHLFGTSLKIGYDRSFGLSGYSAPWLPLLSTSGSALRFVNDQSLAFFVSPFFTLSSSYELEWIDGFAVDGIGYTNSSAMDSDRLANGDRFRETTGITLTWLRPLLFEYRMRYGDFPGSTPSLSHYGAIALESRFAQITLWGSFEDRDFPSGAKPSPLFSDGTSTIVVDGRETRVGLTLTGSLFSGRANPYFGIDYGIYDLALKDASGGIVGGTLARPKGDTFAIRGGIALRL